MAEASRDRGSCCGRWTSVLWTVAISLIIALLLSIVLTGNRSNGSSTPGSSPIGNTNNTVLPPFSPPSNGNPTQNQNCPTEAAQYQSCLSQKLSNTQSESCVTCVNSAMQSSSFDSCNSFKSNFCPLFNACSHCSQCASEIETYIDCAVGGDACFVNCDGNSSGSATCSAQQTVYQTCFESQLTSFEASSCADCVTTSLHASSTASCSSFMSDFCPAFTSCKCGSCASDVQDYVNCLLNDAGDSCTVNCDTTTSGGSSNNGGQCSTGQTTYISCLESRLSAKQARSCVGCVNDAIRTASTDSCVDFEQSFCPDFTLCSCGSCKDELEGYIDCVIGNGGCTINCTGGTTSTATYPNTHICNDYSASSSNYDPSGYQICLDLNVLSGDESVFQAASTSWSGKVVGDVPSVSSSAFDTRFACSAYPPVIDDLYICGSYQSIDGVNGILGQSTPVYTRLGSHLPIVGIMAFDSADVAALKSAGTFEAVILHEMGHVLGFGSIWQTLNLIGSIGSGCPYYGNNANHEWQLISGCSSSVPIQQTGGDGTKCSHWDENCLENELMTGYLNNANPIFSNITIAGMADLGYQVDYSQAESFTTSNLNSTCVCNRRLRAESEFSRGETRSNYRRLSPEGYRAAHEYGKRHLNEMKEIGKTMKKSDVFKFVGDQLVTIYYVEDGTIYHVHVTP